MDTKNILMAEVFGELEGSNDPSSSEQESKESTPPIAEVISQVDQLNHAKIYFNKTKILFPNNK